MPNHRFTQAHWTSSTARASGLGEVEILIALALVLVLVARVAGVAGWAVSRLNDQRLLLTEARLGQDLHATVDLIARDLKRAGHWGGAESGLWKGPGSVPLANPYVGLHPAAGSATPGTSASVGYRYSRDTTENHLVDSNEVFGLRVNPNTQAFELRLSGSGLPSDTGDQWQALTDPATLRITRWQAQHKVRTISLIGRCADSICPTPVTGASPCPPQLWRHLLNLDLEARDARDPTVRRSLATQVLLRNDEIVVACSGS